MFIEVTSTDHATHYINTAHIVEIRKNLKGNAWTVLLSGAPYTVSVLEDDAIELLAFVREHN